MRTVCDDLAGLTDPNLKDLLSTIAPTVAGPVDDLALLPAPSAGAAAQRFRVLRLHARGGLGQVMLAHDRELQREVALKEIQGAHADDPEAQARFVLEAEVTGRLEHPGIVPVYSLGHSPDGRPYYAMRFIHGDSLEEEIRRFHEADRQGRSAGERDLALRGLLRRFVDVCNTIAYAHARGVIHRDIKPANVMLGPYGETLVVDWGLARMTDRPENVPRPQAGTLHPLLGSDSGRTQAGTVLGTPPYMSPEQAEGKVDELGPASDVYSLGATLYHLLTGKAPLEGDVREVLARARRGDFPPPRQVNKLVSARLEAVVLKAMAHRPEDRYATPGELADDIEHWLADLPLRACPDSAWRKLGRWSRRHRPLVASATALLLTSTLALTVGIILLGSKQRETDRQRRQAETAREEAREKSAQADLQRSLALATLRDVVEDRQLAQQQDGEEAGDPEAIHRARITLLREAIKRLEKLGAVDEAAEALVRAHLNLGDLLLRTEQPAEAQREFERARAAAAALLRSRPGDARRRDLWQALMRLGEGALARGQPRAAAALLLEALETARPLEERGGAGRLEGLRAVYAAQLRLAEAYRDDARLVDAAAHFRDAAATAGKLVEYKAAGARRDRGLALLRLGEVRLLQKEGRMAVEQLLDARLELEKMSEAERNSARGLGELARAHDRLAEAHRLLGEPDLAERSRTRAQKLYERLGRENLDNVAVQQELAERHRQRGRQHEELFEFTEAGDDYEKAAEVLLELKKRGKLARQPRLAKLLQEVQARQEACKRARLALTDLEWLRGLPPDQGVPLFVLRARVLARQVRLREAEETARELAEAYPNRPEVLYGIARCFAVCADGVAAGQPRARLAGRKRDQFDQLCRQALTALERARTAGYFRKLERVLEMRKEPDLAALAALPEFRKFQARLIEGRGK